MALQGRSIKKEQELQERRLTNRKNVTWRGDSLGRCFHLITSSEDFFVFYFDPDTLLA